MPDLRNTYVGANHRRVIDNFSRFGTRKLAFYKIYIYGLSDAVRDTLYNDEEIYDPEFPREWIETPGNILEAVYRGVQLVAEPYAFGDWDIYEDTTDYNDLYLTVIVAADTFLDDTGQQDSPVPANPNSYSLENAIADAIADFANDGLYCERMILRGDYLDTTGDYALGRGNQANKDRQSTFKAARTAAGKNKFKR